ncbi:MAG: c-type cytochrome [Desulfotalea sp.]
MKSYIIASLLVICSIPTCQIALAHDWMAPKNAREIISPVPANIESINTGKKLYESLCASCHGDSFEGGLADQLGLKKDPPALKSKLKTHSDGDFVWKIKTGREEMPAFSDELTDLEIWSIMHYLKAD